MSNSFVKDSIIDYWFSIEHVRTQIIGANRQIEDQIIAESQRDYQ